MKSENDTYNAKTLTDTKSNVQSYLENNYEDIEKIELSDPYQAPLGSMTIDGTVNSDKSFSVSLNKDLTIASLAIQSDDFPAEKDECKEKTCDY
ncbi:hypothetical protein [Terribacillus sp. DMT04]|uniref:hypothetical protein n=1 Tax=Terribacillus sp. DMT04 TaxID=2850441 RepID=UPI001C2C5B9A|nr:hypothetical protein [Terribacillus sp. DMT04]QXE01970.1 hypothetical protein KS242_01570 [Terribacillus sp. DMT04]